MFSSRLPGNLVPNALAAAATRARQRNAALIDLTVSNPTLAGLAPPASVFEALADPRAATYTPDPRGLPDARRAVARSYASTGEVDPDRIVLTASTSEAYSLLFKLLCDPGEDVLVPVPSYPLFEMLTTLDGVRAVPYGLHREDRWSIDRAGLESALTPRSRAILVVSPNNPTGSMLGADDAAWLLGVARDRDLAVVADEVFGDYRFEPRPDAISLLGDDRALVFTLGGLSKSAGLPQAKLAWLVVSGPAGAVEPALTRLEIINDAYLSVSTSVQLAAGALLAEGALARDRIRARLARNLRSLASRLARDPALTLLEPEGGWSAVVRVPAVVSEEALAIRLVEEAGVLVHPGFFFDFPEEAFLVISLLPEPALFDTALDRLTRVVMAEASA